jgi:hypothetical protein
MNNRSAAAEQRCNRADRLAILQVHPDSLGTLVGVECMPSSQGNASLARLGQAGDQCPTSLMTMWTPRASKSRGPVTRLTKGKDQGKGIPLPPP